MLTTHNARKLLTLDPVRLRRPLPWFVSDLLAADGQSLKPLSVIRREVVAQYYDADGDCLRHPFGIILGYDPEDTQQLLTDDYAVYGTMVHYYDPVVRILMGADRFLTQLEAGKLNTCVFSVERPFRLEALMWVMDQFAPEGTEVPAALTDLVFDVYRDCERPSPNRDHWLDLMRRVRTGHQPYCDAPGSLDGLPRPLTLYRGTRHADDELEFPDEIGISWTLDERRAIWFSQRWAKDGESVQYLRATVSKADVLAHLTGRNEDEIIPDTDCLSGIEVLVAGAYPLSSAS